MAVYPKTGERWVSAALIVGTASVAAYKSIWKKPLSAFEEKTSVGS